MNTVGQNQKRRKSVVVMMSTIGVLTLIVLATLQFSSRRSKVEPWGGAKSSMVEDDRQLSSGDETATPTESPAPSPSPSEIPTSLPTITPMPTGTPTSKNYRSAVMLRILCQSILTFDVIFVQ